MDKAVHTATLSDTTPTPTASRSIFLSAPVLLLLLGHVTVDTYSILVPASLGVIEKTYALTRGQAAWLLGIGSLTSGMAQPICAWLSDRLNTRIFGGVGIALGAGFICCLGFAGGPAGLFLIYVIGMAGIGMFHPIAASTIGQLARHRRSLAVSLFFVAGMVGHMLGSVLGTRMIATWGLSVLLAIMVPGLVLAAALHWQIGGISHRAVPSKRSRSEIGQVAHRWLHLAMLYISAAIRFSVNMSLIYLFVRLTESRMGSRHPELDGASVARLAAPLVGNLHAMMVIGMATGGLLAGSLIRTGREKWPLVLTPVLFAPAIVALPWVPAAYAGYCTFLAGLGFASMVPVTVSLAQRLLPERTSLASGITLGGAWAFALVGPRITEAVSAKFGLPIAFAAVGGALVISGIGLVPMSSRLVHRSRKWT